MEYTVAPGAWLNPQWVLGLFRRSQEGSKKKIKVKNKRKKIHVAKMGNPGIGLAPIHVRKFTLLECDFGVTILEPKRKYHPVVNFQFNSFR